MEKSCLLLLFTYLCGVLGDTYYSSYYGLPISEADVQVYTTNGTLQNCTNLIAPCDEFEPRRIDGTCNNLKHPSFGATRTPYYRILDAIYYQPSPSEFDPKLSKSGQVLKGARDVRTKIWSEGRVDDEDLTSLITHFFVFYATDITNTRDTSNYVFWRPKCCQGSTDYACAPNKVSENDFVHRFSGIRCLNMTRPLTFQTSGCLPNTTTPLRIVDATPTQDLSPVYGNVIEKARRTFSGGKLVTVDVNNRSFPDTASLGLLLGVNFFGIIFFWRHHNFIADQLAIVNPSWTDEQLFATAREINIAYGMQIFYYELMATLMGAENLKNDGILSASPKFRNVYNPNVLPQISLEYPVVLRWVHSLQDGELRMYNTDGTYRSAYPIVDLTSNTDFLKEGDTMDAVTQGCFRQPTGNSKDYIVDPDIVQRGLGGLQTSNDIMTNDLAKNRYFGFQGYIYYRQYCFGDNITSFDDLAGTVDEERITQLKDLYESVEDIDLLAGIWVEKLMEGTHVPPTFYCIVTEQLHRTMVSDRHWYESSNRPNAFTKKQLRQIRKASAARMLCDIGDAVTEIQPKAFQLPSDTNEIVSCDDITSIDFHAWQDKVNYVLYVPHCCKAKGRTDNRCSPITVPRDDPVHRFSGISCLNLTKPVGFHSYNCTDNRSTYQRMVFTTSVLDLSQTYDSMPGYITKLRAYKNGLLIIEKENGRLYPPSDPNSIFCPMNERPRETRCLKYHANPSIGSSLMNILFYRFHNHIAKILRKLNPCWDDDRLFYTARDINIAVSVKIFFYDLLPILLGKENMIREGLISRSQGFRDMYDESIQPQVTDEYVYIQRWFHTIQETKLKLYDKDGCFLKTYPTTNLTTRTGFFSDGDNIVHLTQGCFRQECGGFDHTMDVEMGEQCLGELQAATDVGSSDLFKGRLFGFAPYIKYREFCTRWPVKSFCDLKNDISPERLSRVREVYKHPKDIDLMAGIWVERRVKGGKVPKTLYCLMVDQLKRIIKSDRHWFERCNRPHPFSLGQLIAVRKTTISGMLCAVGDCVTEVQPNAFCTISRENPLTKCSSRKIGNLDLSPWKDPRCCKWEDSREDS